MKHAIIIAFAALFVYILWFLLDPGPRSKMVKDLMPHVNRILLILGIILVFVVMAFYFPSVTLL